MSHRSQAGIFVTLAGVVLMAVCARGFGADNHMLRAVAYTGIGEGELQQLNFEDPSATAATASASGANGNYASASVRRNTLSGKDFYLFRAETELTGDAGPLFWKTKFPNMENAHTEAYVTANGEESFYFEKPTPFRMTYTILDPDGLLENGDVEIGIDHFNGNSYDALHERYATRDGSFTFTGILPAGSSRVRVSLDNTTGTLGPTYPSGSAKSVSGRTTLLFLIDFIPWSAAGLEWSKKVAGFSKAALDLRARADELQAGSAEEEAVLGIARRNLPSEFDLNFRVIPNAGKKGMYDIVPRNPRRMERFTGALASSIENQNRLRRRHDHLMLLAEDAVARGYLPTSVRLKLDWKYPAPSPFTGEKLRKITFFQKEASYTATEVERLEKEYAAALQWFDKQLPVLQKRVDRLDGRFDFIVGSLGLGYEEYDRGIRKDTALTVQEQSVLRTSLLFAEPAWEE